MGMIDWEDHCEENRKLLLMQIEGGEEWEAFERKRKRYDTRAACVWMAIYVAGAVWLAWRFLG